MKTFKHIGMIGVLAAGALLTACSDKDDYTPGPEVSSGCQQVRFADTNNPICVLDEANTDDRTATLTLKRNNTGAALTIPIKVVSQSMGLNIPAEVTFAASDSLAKLAIKAPEKVAVKDVYKYELRLEGDNADPYTKLDGSVVCRANSTSPYRRRPNFMPLLVRKPMRCSTLGRKR